MEHRHRYILDVSQSNKTAKSEYVFMNSEHHKGGRYIASSVINEENYNHMEDKGIKIIQKIILTRLEE